MNTLPPTPRPPVLATALPIIKAPLALLVDCVSLLIIVFPTMVAKPPTLIFSEIPTPPVTTNEPLPEVVDDVPPPIFTLPATPSPPL